MRSDECGKRLISRVDLDALMLDDDRAGWLALAADEEFQEAIRRACRDSSIARRACILASLPLTADVAPELFQAVEHVRTRLGIEATLAVHCIAEPMLSLITPADDGRVLLGISRVALERLDTTELTFVLGHEFGHALFDHFSLSLDAPHMSELLSPSLRSRYHAWRRYAELSADRVGLLACQDADVAVHTFFKLTGGLSEPSAASSPRPEPITGPSVQHTGLGGTDADWFSTHPYSPLRLKALDVFARARQFHDSLGRSGGDLDRAAVEREIRDIMQLAADTQVDDQDDASRELGDFLALAGVAVAAADGTVVDAEHDLVIELVGPEGRLSDGALIEDLDDQEFERRMLVAAEKLCLKLPVSRRRQIMEDLVAIALADEDLADAEVEVLGACAVWLGVDPEFVQEAIARHGAALG